MTNRNNRTDFLALIESDPEFRAKLVETLRLVASLLDGSHPFDPVDESELLARLGYQMAPRVREYAQRLCDHCRVSSDGRCRYCELLMAEGA